MPTIPKDVQEMHFKQLRQLAKDCRLKTNRSAEALIKDLILIREGKQNAVLLFNWTLSRLEGVKPATVGIIFLILLVLSVLSVCATFCSLQFSFWNTWLTFKESLQHLLNTNNIPDILVGPLEEYQKKGYVIIPGMFNKQQLEVAHLEWNYHTQSRGIELNDPTTWKNIHLQPDWKQGWAKWMFTTGIQVCCTTPLFLAKLCEHWTCSCKYQSAAHSSLSMSGLRLRVRLVYPSDAVCLHFIWF